MKGNLQVIWGKCLETLGQENVCGVGGGDLDHKFYFISLSTHPGVSEYAEVNANNSWKHFYNACYKSVLF